jgi:hypothetical protein
VARAREVNCAVPLELVNGDLLEVSFTQPFDAILCRGVLNDFVSDADRGFIFRQFANLFRMDGVLIFDVREWTRTAARYKQNPVHRRTVEMPGGVLHFQSETVLHDQSRRMLIRERFEMEREGVGTCVENDFVMRAWTLDEIYACLDNAGFAQIESHATYGEVGQTWSDRAVVIARKR